MHFNLNYTYSDFTHGMALFLKSTQRFSPLNRFFYHKSFWYASTWFTLGVFFVVFAFSRLFFAVPLNKWVDFLWWPVFSSIGVLLLIVPLAVRRSIARYFRQSPVSSVPIDLEIDDTGIVEKTEVTRAATTWKAVSKAVYDEDIVLLFSSDANFFYAIPRRVVSPGEWDELINIVQNNVQNYSYYSKVDTQIKQKNV